MKYCTHCGKELMDEAVICVNCGCKVDNEISSQSSSNVDSNGMLQKLSQRINTNAIIWIVIAVLQILAGLLINWFLLIVGALNIISAISDMNYSKTVMNNPYGIVKKFEPLTMPIITLIYNLIIGGVIGVVGSIYYFCAIRSFVMENKQFFESLDS